MSLESRLIERLNKHQGAGRFVLAYSGGLDSSVLLHLLHQIRPRLWPNKAIVPLHINHQLSPQANAWQQHCLQQAQSLGLCCEVVRVEVLSDGKGLEAAARKARYQAFEHFLRDDDVLLMAHHQDDQAETLLLRLCRGAGVLGLAAMHGQRKVGRAQLLRPLLNLPRQALTEYAHAHDITWVEDESNQDQGIDRNYLRQTVIPALQLRWPQVARQLSQTAELMREGQCLLAEVAEEDLQALDYRIERWGVSLDWKRLKGFSQMRRNNLLRFWCQRQSMPLLDSQQLAEINKQFFQRNSMLTGAVVSWSGCELRQYNHRLYLMAALTGDVEKTSSSQWYYTHRETIFLGAAGQLSLVEAAQTESATSALSLAALESDTLDIRWRQGGERCTPAGREKSQVVKKLLQEHHLETWLRDRVPLVYCNDQLVAVGDLWVCKKFSADALPAVKLKWELTT